MSNTVVRIIKHEESFEVRVSTFFYFEDHPEPAVYHQAHEARRGGGSREDLREGPARSKPSPPKPDHEWETL